MGRNIDEIEVLSGLEAVRRRPSLYVGPLDLPATLSALVEQVMCASLDEAVSGLCQRIVVTLSEDDAATVTDDGPGMRVDIDQHGMSWPERLMTTLAACRGARKHGDVAIRFCGLGIAVVNGLSESCQLEVRRDGKTWVQRYRAGKPLAPLADVGSCSETGITVRFRPDPTLFRVRRFDAVDLRQRFASIREEMKIATVLELHDERTAT